MALVYALVAKSDPDHVRYVGRTHFDTPVKRLKAHINQAKRSEELTYKCNWIRKVLTTNDEVEAIILETDLTFKESGIREKHWIAHYRTLGHKLTNKTDGGDGTLGWRPTDATRRNMSLAQHSRSKEHQEKLLASRANYTVSEETKQKQREKKLGTKFSEERRAAAAGRACSEATREKLRIAQTGYAASDETKAKISKGRTGISPLMSEETKKNMSLAKIGKPWSEARKAAFRKTLAER